ncbi:phosphoadenosine phosphosulfate reductase family protein [Haladaptatus sp. CMSO5]|uniref:phosphoadenosine phosphosulfate reductase family protein n=1 Tax=Haladaptatus sp. CMSO5 TaxID=3120514 RepID=UPI002FCE3555
MPEGFPSYLSVDYEDGHSQSAADYPSVDEKIAKAINVTQTALSQYKNPAIMWTGGKDSTLVLYFAKEVADEFGYEMPPVVFIDHYEHFDDVTAFVHHWADKLDLDLIISRNEDFARLGASPGDEILVSDLSEQNQRELRDRLDHTDDTFVLSADSYAGNHLLKTVALNNTITEHDIDGVFSGVRWDEQDARKNETFFSPRHDSEKYPPHDRVHPILQFNERSLWDAFWYYLVPDLVADYPQEGYVPQGYDDLPNGLTPEDLPVGPKYFEGFRSLGTSKGSAKSDDRPAWLQDLEHTTERAGRAQDKEGLMARLRDLGYM